MSAMDMAAAVGMTSSCRLSATVRLVTRIRSSAIRFSDPRRGVGLSVSLWAAGFFRRIRLGVGAHVGALVLGGPVYYRPVTPCGFAMAAARDRSRCHTGDKPGTRPPESEPVCIFPPDFVKLRIHSAAVTRKVAVLKKGPTEVVSFSNLAASAPAFAGIRHYCLAG